MFELEDYSTGGFHEGYLNKYPDSTPTLDFYISDSLQDMLDIDIRSEIANVVGSSNELASLVSDLPSFDHAVDATSSVNTSTSTASNSNCSSSNSYLHSSAWFNGTSGPTWSSSSNDFYADVGACVNPISVMPMISSSLLLRSPKVNLNVNGLSSATSPPPPSPIANKSHLTFSPAHVKTNMANSTKSNRIPKKIVAISSAVTSATTAPATMATNSALQRRNTAAIEAIKKDLSFEMLKKGSDASAATATTAAKPATKSNIAISATNTIKLAPGIGGLTFANSITYNKLQEQAGVKSAGGSPLTTNGTIVLKRDRDSSPLHHMTTLGAPSNGASGGTAVSGGFMNGQQITKVLVRNVVQTNGNFTPKSIASAQSPMLQTSANSFSAGSPSSSTGGSSNGLGAGRLTPIAPNGGGRLTPSGSGGGRLTPGNVAPATAAPGGRLTPNVKSPLIQKKKQKDHSGSEFPKPAYSYSCLIAMALKNSRAGSLPVSEIYSFMCEHFPYFRTAPNGWKNSVRHNLSLNKCFEKIEKPVTSANQRKGCLWAMNPDRIIKMDEEVQKWSRKDPAAIRKAMIYPEHLESLERGEMKHGSTSDSDLELDSQSEIEETSDSDQEHEELVDDALVDSMFVEEDIEEVVAEDEISGQQVGGGVCDVVSAACDEKVTVADEAQQHRDFDIEVEDIYDAIDVEDDKETVHLAIDQSADVIEMGTADILKAQAVVDSSGYQSPKRARLNVNYSIRAAAAVVNELDKQHGQQQSLLTNSAFKQIKVQAQQQGQQQPKHIVLQTLTPRGNSPHNQQHQQLPTLTHFTAMSNQSRRKMQLVNRIA